MTFLLDCTENPPGGDDSVPDLMVQLLLALNLHYDQPSENMVMRVLTEQQTAKTFTEKVMLLVNRGGEFIFNWSSLWFLQKHWVGPPWLSHLSLPLTSPSIYTGLGVKASPVAPG